MKQINLSNQDYASILMLMEKASRLISRDYTTPSERNIARRMNILRRKLEKK